MRGPFDCIGQLLESRHYSAPGEQAPVEDDPSDDHMAPEVVHCHRRYGDIPLAFDVCCRWQIWERGEIITTAIKAGHIGYVG